MSSQYDAPGSNHKVGPTVSRSTFQIPRQSPKVSPPAAWSAESLYSILLPLLLLHFSQRSSMFLVVLLPPLEIGTM